MGIDWPFTGRAEDLARIVGGLTGSGDCAGFVVAVQQFAIIVHNYLDEFPASIVA